VSQFLGIAIFIVIAAGMMIHSGFEFPWFLDWIGKLPGDVLIKKKGLVLYAPLTSSLLISAVLSFLVSLFSSKEK
jgi:hypothetical protein